MASDRDLLIVPLGCFSALGLRGRFTPLAIFDCLLPCRRRKTFGNCTNGNVNTATHLSITYLDPYHLIIVQTGIDCPSLGALKGLPPSDPKHCRAHYSLQ
jgi:hypothetical protein